MGAQHESGNGAASIEAREDEFLCNFELLDDTLLQFEYILSFIGDLNAIPEEDRTNDCKMEGCASNAWLMLEARNGRLKLSLGSDSLIIEGLLGALTWMLNTQPLEDVAAWQPLFLKHPQMKPDETASQQRPPPRHSLDRESNTSVLRSEIGRGGTFGMLPRNDVTSPIRCRNEGVQLIRETSGTKGTS